MCCHHFCHKSASRTLGNAWLTSGDWSCARNDRSASISTVQCPKEVQSDRLDVTHYRYLPPLFESLEAVAVYESPLTPTSGVQGHDCGLTASKSSFLVPQINHTVNRKVWFIRRDLRSLRLLLYALASLYSRGRICYSLSLPCSPSMVDPL